MVAVHDSRFPSAEGKAETPGAGEVINCINSVCSLPNSQHVVQTLFVVSLRQAYLLVVLWESGPRAALSLAASKLPGAEF